MNQAPIQRAIAKAMPAAISTGLFVSLCTIQAPTGSRTSSGAPLPTAFANVSGLVNIPCMDAPPSMSTIQATEVKALEEIMALGLRDCLLNGYYPALTQGNVTGTGMGWRAIVDGVTYDLMGAEFDSQTTQTRIRLRLATV